MTPKTRMSAVMVLCLLFFAAIGSRAAYIQVIGDERLEKLARRQFKSKMLIRPRRGIITDRNAEPLAVNIETKSLAVNPSKIQNKRTMARLLSKATDLPYSKLLTRFGEKREFAWIKRHMSEGDINRLKKWRIIDPEGNATAGFFIVKESKRVYPHGDVAAHILGSVNLDAEGLEGVELWGDELLRGKMISVNAEKDALGRPTFIDAETAQRIKDGESIALTIDASLQFEVEQELRNAVLKSGARAGGVIVMNAVNGEILAMANEPSFDPNDRSTTASHRRNRVVTDGFEPGSIMKPVLLAGALSFGAHLTDQIFAERGTFTVQGKRISEAEAHEKFDWLTLKKIIQVSSNVGAAKLALKVGADRYLTTLKSFGFGAKTNIGFPGEISGKIPNRKAWQPLTLANIGFGQGILVTPLQMVRAYAVFANGGWLVQPRLIQTPMKNFVQEPPRRILNAKALDGVVEALKSVTDDKGTGIKARLEGYEIAGKTGTAQEVDPGTGKYSRSRYVASFVGFPVGVEPKLVIFTAIDEPRGVYYASETAAPLFKAVLSAAANRFSLPTTLNSNRKLAHHPDRPASAMSDRVKVSLAKVTKPEEVATPAPLAWVGTATDGSISWKMPALAGLTVREAIRSLQGHRFDLEVHGTGIVRSQVPEDGKTIAEGGRIRLTLAEP